MEHFYPSVPGWCDYADYYSEVIAALPDGASVVEVGVYQGQSTAALGVEIANSGKSITFDCVDHFQGSPGEINGAVPLPDLRERFEANVAPIRHLIRHVIAEASVEASRQYAPASLDFVWLDAAHDSASVLADLSAWWPLVKPGGTLAGHDADWPSVQAAIVPFSHLSGVDVERVSSRSWQMRKPDAVTDWSVPIPRRNCLVVVASNERTIGRGTVESLITLGWGARVQQAAEAHGFQDIRFTWISRHVRVDDLRNEACKLALATDASHILFLDADMTWPGDVLNRMLAHHDQGVVSGLYFLKTKPHQPIAFDSGYVNLQTGEVDYVYDEDVLQHKTLQSAALVGMGCALIPVALLEAMPEPWFEYRQNRHGVWTITEDVAFCQKAAAYNCPISVDPTVACGHVGAEVVTDEQFYRTRMEEKMTADFVKSRRAKLQAVSA